MTDGGPVRELSTIVQDACIAADAPVGVTSIVVGYTRFFRAWQGLPSSFDDGRAAGFCDTFAQFVSREDRPWLVADFRPGEVASSALRRDLETIGVRAYLGQPVYVGDRFLGALCVLDPEPRSWPQSVWERLADLAEQVSGHVRGATGIDETPGTDPRLHDELLAMIRLMRGLSAGPVTLDDARVALSVLGHPPDRLHALQHDPTLREALQTASGVDLTPLIVELGEVG